MMYEYYKVCVFNKKMNEKVKRAPSYMTRWLEEQPYEEPLICVQTDGKKDRGFVKTLKAWEEGFSFHKHKYKYWCAGAGDSRKKQWYMIREELFEPALEKFMCGLKIEDINKLYKGKHIMSALRETNYLSMSLTSGMKVNVNLDRIACIKDIETEIHYVADWIDAENNIINKGQCIDEGFDLCDGGGICRPGMFELQAFTYRLPWHKGCICEFPWDLVPETLTDCWGKSVSRDDVDIILTDSQFKAWKCYSSWQNFVDCCRETNAEFNICVETEDKEWFEMAYQPLQTLKLTDDEIGELLTGNLRSLERWTKDPKAIAKAIGLPVPTPEVLNSRLYLQKIREFLDSKIKALVCGKVRLAGGFYFLIPDWRAAFGHEGLKPGECSCQGAVLPEKVQKTPQNGGKWQQNDVIWCARYPHMATREHVLLQNVNPEWAPQGCIIVNAQDNACLRLNAD